MSKLHPLLPVVICRSAAPPEPIEPSYQQGFFCMLCNKPVQVTPTGYKQIFNGGQPVCNRCGVAIITAAADMRKPATLQINPAAQREIERVEGKPILEIFPNAQTKIEEE